MLAMGFALTTQMIMAQAPSYVSTNGLVGYWPFNGNANDESGNGNNGTVNGATLTIDRYGNSNKAFDFGTNKYIEVLNNASINLSSSISISIWVKAQPSTNLIRKGYQYGIDLDVFNSSGNTNGLYPHSYQPTLFSPNPVIQNSWTHIVVTNGNNIQKMYNNGVLIKTTNIVTTYTLYPNNLTIGSWYLNETYNGSLDDIGIWNRALTQEEINNLYYAENTCQSLVINTGVLGYNPVTYSNTITIYPNPANDHITIDCGNLANVSGWTIKIVNTLGQEVFTGAMNTQQYVVPLNTWSGQGVYFVKLYDASNNLVNTKKIILQ